MWFLIKQTVKDPQSPSVLQVQRVVNREVKEYVVQEEDIYMLATIPAKLKYR
jgi:hypothetical protein